MLEKPERAIKNGQSRDIGNIGHTRHRVKTNKTRGYQEWTILRYWQHWAHKTQGEDKQNKGLSRMDNPEILATLGTQDTGWRQTQQGAIKNGQSRDIGNIGHTRHRVKTNTTRGYQEWTIQRYWQHWAHKAQGEDKHNKGLSRMDNPEILATLGTQGTGWRQTQQGAIKNGQSRDIGNIGHTRHRVKTNKTRGYQDNPEILATLGTQDTGWRQTQQGAIKNGQSRDIGNIGHTRHRMKTNTTRGYQEWTIQRYWQHWAHKAQGEDKQNTTLHNMKYHEDHNCFSHHSIQ